VAIVPAPPAPDAPLPTPKLFKLFGLAALMAFLVLMFGGLAVRAYVAFRRAEDVLAYQHDFWGALFTFAIAGAIALGALVVSWRLAYRKGDDPRWGMALFLSIIVLFGLLVWPTPWKYSEYGCKIFQINRFIGRYTELPTKVPGCDPDKPPPAQPS
jgi:hypothetical protein